jgi:hypothetical protein
LGPLLLIEAQNGLIHGVLPQSNLEDCSVRVSLT